MENILTLMWAVLTIITIFGVIALIYYYYELYDDLNSFQVYGTFEEEQRAKPYMLFIPFYRWFVKLRKGIKEYKSN